MSRHGPETVPSVATPTDALLVPGETCWQIAHAERLSVIVDGAEYFRHLRAALRAGRQAIYLIGWDLDLRLEMIPGESDEDGLAPDGMPNRLGDFLRHVVDAVPEVSIYLLKWDKAMLVQLSQQFLETAGLKLASSRIHFALDSHHPTGATHHQKIVVVDDRFAFCGGIDVTAGRWDTRDHLPDDPRRTDPSGDLTKPWHDATTALSGPVAAALGDLSRARWEAATGEVLDAPTVSSAPWPEALDVDLSRVEVGISRTVPDYRGQAPVDEIEGLYLAAIGAARRTIYLESQYFASGTICRALEARLAEPDGPELVVVNPDRAEGFLQHQVMDTGRARMIERIRAAASRGGGGPDGGRRFGIFYPANAADEPIYVHAKVLIVDDRLVRIGSSNVNNRSLDFDTECDVAFEPSDAAQRAYARRLRASLLGEHLGCAPEAVARAIDAEGSVLGAIEALNGTAERQLHPIGERPSDDFEREVGERILFDESAHPRHRPRPLRRVGHNARRAVAPYHLEAAGAGAVLVGVATFGLGMLAGLGLARLRARRRARRFPAPAVHTSDRPRAGVVAAGDRDVLLAVEPEGEDGPEALVRARRRPTR
jgi:phospholipase D1/2